MGGREERREKSEERGLGLMFLYEMGDGGGFFVDFLHFIIMREV